MFTSEQLLNDSVQHHEVKNTIFIITPNHNNKYKPANTILKTYFFPPAIKHAIAMRGRPISTPAE
jgi:hypothetical protein